MSIEEQYGYILIDTPEKKAKYAPKLATDEYLINAQDWHPVWPCGSNFVAPVYRRKIDVGEGWRLVGFDEPIQEGDEMLYRDTDYGFFKAGKPWFGTTPRSGWEIDIKSPAFRRKKSAPVADGWTDVVGYGGLVLPPADRAVWFVDRANHVRYCPKFTGDSSQWVKWRFAGDEVPKPPAPSAKEIAFEKAVKEHGNAMVNERFCRIFFDAGIAFANSQKQTT